ncbi:dihydrodipicolinate synthase family protein, partial [Klebsiella pneumoniae]
HLPSRVTLGFSGDACATAAVQAGCEAWNSVCGGLFTRCSLALVRARRSGDVAPSAAGPVQLARGWRGGPGGGGVERVG